MTSTSIATDPTLRQGDSGAAVSELQQLLNAKGFNITVDGVFGDATRAAVVQFQRQNGLVADGVVGTQTWQALRRGGNEQDNIQATSNLTPAQEALQALWEEHVQYEFGTHSTEDALATMVEDAYVNNVPVMTGGVGKPAVGKFYSKYFIPQIPPDLELIPISRTLGTDQLVDEMVAKFTHTVSMDWMLPGVAPTEKQVEVPVVAIIRFRDGKLAHEHIYWDQASVLVQVGLLESEKLPVVGVDSARKLMNPNLPSNTLIDRASDINPVYEKNDLGWVGYPLSIQPNSNLESR